jgi:hypothetical protein
MTQFQPEPVLILESDKDVAECVTQCVVRKGRDGVNSDYSSIADFFGLVSSRDVYRIKSTWLIALIDEIAASTYPYNSTVQRAAETRLGIPAQPDNGSLLSLLIYNAQGYRRSDKLIAAGFRPLTQRMLEDAFRLKAQIATAGDVCGDSVYNVRMVSGKLYAMKPRKRKWAAQISGQPARIVKNGKPIGEVGAWPPAEGNDFIKVVVAS